MGPCKDLVWEEAPNNQNSYNHDKKFIFYYYSTGPFDRPAPIPLGNLKDQKEFEELVRKNQGSFISNKNPVTGEVNGPKEDPLKHGSDWSYGSRVTDF
ncbi:9018_t:CDS:2 [Entrophospora sp. SA101]|nr:9018_t:CDS:2 [Entrophospora sp. SA101]